ncbi:unnamed protein product [Ranitomeya imitator]|uniref:Uncharacterized protein n=1 Tax=Ranitomeya imitator TaxID=111125 RepID=A0ABN9MRF2_9NEOB|nr:unnamed protein product [Ranitomeya imitator]
MLKLMTFPDLNLTLKAPGESKWLKVVISRKGVVIWEEERMIHDCCHHHQTHLKYPSLHRAPKEKEKVSLFCTPSVSVIILYPESQCHYHVPRVSASLSCTPSVSVIILYPKCQCHYPVPRVSVSLSCTLSVSVIILYPECQCHYPVPRVSVPLSCTPTVSVIILYPQYLTHTK